MFSIFCDHVEILPGEEYAGLADWSVVVVSVCPSLPSKVLNDERNVSEYFHSCCIVVVCGNICFDCNRLFIFLSEHVLSYLRIPTGILFLALVSLNSDLLIFNLQDCFSSERGEYFHQTCAWALWSPHHSRNHSHNIFIKPALKLLDLLITLVISLS